MRTPLLLRVLFSSALCVIASATSCEGADSVYDRQYTNGFGSFLPLETVSGFGRYGQSFYPVLDGLDFVQLRVSDGNFANDVAPKLYVEIRKDFPFGPLIATSLPAQGEMNAQFAITMFSFTSRIRLEPGMRYVVVPRLTEFTTIPGTQELVPNDAASVNSGSTFDPIPKPGSGVGNLMDGNVFEQTKWMWFREGISVPEPSAGQLGLVGVCALLVYGYIRGKRGFVQL